MVFMIMLPGIATEAKTKPGLAAGKKNMTAWQAYRLELKSVSRKAKVKWKTNKTSVVSIAKKKENPIADNPVLAG